MVLSCFSVCVCVCVCTTNRPTLSLLTVSALGDTIPLLLKKLDRLDSVQMPNISENILRIRQLIAQARKAASKVPVHNTRTASNPPYQPTASPVMKDIDTENEVEWQSLYLNLYGH